MNFCRLLVVGFVLMSLNPANAQGLAWRQYESSAWSYRIQYPEIFNLVTDAPESGGATITTPDGQARLLVLGGPNVRQGGSRELADDLALVDDVHQVTYRRVTNDWIVLSGYLADESGARTDIIFYQRIELSPDRERVAGFRLEYRAAMRGTLDHLIGNIGRSLAVN